MFAMTVRAQNTRHDDGSVSGNMQGNAATQQTGTAAEIPSWQNMDGSVKTGMMPQSADAVVNNVVDPLQPADGSNVAGAITPQGTAKKNIDIANQRSDVTKQSAGADRSEDAVVNLNGVATAVSRSHYNAADLNGKQETKQRSGPDELQPTTNPSAGNPKSNQVPNKVKDIDLFVK
jgi:hypothetical protein